MDAQIHQIRNLIKRYRSRGSRRHLPSQLKAEIVAYAQRKRDQGVKWSRIESDLNIRANSIREWMETTPPATPSTPDGSEGMLIPIQVISEEPYQSVCVPQSNTYSIVSPTGFRLAGLTLGEALAVLKELA